MTVGQILLEVDYLNDEELNNLAVAINSVKRDRAYARQEEAMEKLRNAWNTLTALGICVYDNSGNEINNFDELGFEWRSL